MIDAKEASEIAFNHFSDLYKGQHQNLACEEVEVSEDQSRWNVTLGFDIPGRHSVMTGPASREYKLVAVDANTGNVISMKIHHL